MPPACLASRATTSGVTVITELADLGVADHVVESISGRLSRRMLEHYSHIRIDAQRQALDALEEARRGDEKNGDSSGGDDRSRPRKTQERHGNSAARGYLGEPHVTVTSRLGVGGIAPFL
jgi:hypothetical protein